MVLMLFFMAHPVRVIYKIGKDETVKPFRGLEEDTLIDHTSAALSRFS